MTRHENRIYEEGRKAFRDGKPKLKPLKFPARPMLLRNRAIFNRGWELEHRKANHD